MTSNAILAMLAAVGITALLMASAALYSAVRIAGGVYLVWLGVQAVRAYIRMRKDSSGLVPVVAADAPGAMPGTRRRSFRQGFLCNILNPKVAAFYLALFPQFDFAPLSPAVEHAVLAGLFWVMGLVWYILTISLLDRIRGVLRSPSFARRTEATAGAALLGMGAWVLSHAD